MVMKRPMFKSSHSSRPPAPRHVNSFVTEQDRERERQATAEQEAAGEQPRTISFGDDAALRQRLVGDCLDRYGRRDG